MGGEDESTIENRVYLFREMAAAFVANHGGLLSSDDPAERARGRRGLAEIARAACTFADLEEASPAEVAAAIEADD